MNSHFHIGIVDDDPGFRGSIRRLLRSEGFGVSDFPDGTTFLAEADCATFDCLILDLHMPGITGVELQGQLRAAGHASPIIFLTGAGDIPTSVSAMKAGAVDFLTKPVDDIALFAAIAEALKKNHRDAQVEKERDRLQTLSPREREVFAHVITGKLNKQIAEDLGISEQTVKVHRMRLTQKLQEPSVVGLVRLADRLGVQPASP
ncbi:MAG: response regulator transcription factor [Verrucomicrobiae bacterium]|nr:response regulator transcription factor [Verrucomicrobiae bacterium]